MAKVIFRNGDVREVDNLLVWRKSKIPISGSEIIVITAILIILAFVGGLLI